MAEWCSMREKDGCIYINCLFQYYLYIAPPFNHISPKEQGKNIHTNPRKKKNSIEEKIHFVNQCFKMKF